MISPLKFDINYIWNNVFNFQVLCTQLNYYQQSFILNINKYQQFTKEEPDLLLIIIYQMFSFICIFH